MEAKVTIEVNGLKFTYEEGRELYEMLRKIYDPYIHLIPTSPEDDNTVISTFPEDDNIVMGTYY